MSLPGEAMERFRDCMDAAVAAGELEPTAMTLATTDGTGVVTARMVLLKAWDENGFVFYTNMRSLKGRQLAACPQAALVCYWKTINRQVRVDGFVEQVSDRQADEYFTTRDRGAQLGAWASEQSEPLPSRAHLLKRVVQFEARYLGRPVPRPPHWSGYRVIPESIEFWYGRRNRLHDRFRFSRQAAGGWERERLYP
jgi:pyridoxamine 5'-phosphate oxidase